MAIKVLFVCLGNICRSPMAEGVFQKMVDDAGLNDCILTDSAGTASYHVGELADHRMRRTASGYDINLTHRARKIQAVDLHNFDYILAMDHQNLEDILRLDSNPSAQIQLMRSFGNSRDALNVPDPYYEEDSAFDEVYQILEFHSRHLLNYIRETHGI